MKKILVTYATFSGSTVEVARAVAAEIEKQGLQVDVLPLVEVKSLEAYDGVVVGAPMIMGWHRAALGFLKRNRQAFQRVPLAVFVTAMSLTRTAETSVGGVPVLVDDRLPKPPEREGHLSFRERYARPSSYLQPILAATRPVKPVSIGVFGGRLEYGRLKWWAVLFVMLIIRAPAGDRRNWNAIRAWAASLPAAFRLEAPQAAALLHAARPRRLWWLRGSSRPSRTDRQAFDGHIVSSEPTRWTVLRSKKAPMSGPTRSIPYNRKKRLTGEPGSHDAKTNHCIDTQVRAQHLAVSHGRFALQNRDNCPWSCPMPKPKIAATSSVVHVGT